MKLLIFLSMLISASALAKYEFNADRLKKKPEYHRCIRKVRKSCKVKFHHQAISLIKTCKLLVFHSHDVNQIENSNSCKRKIK